MRLKIKSRLYPGCEAAANLTAAKFSIRELSRHVFACWNLGVWQPESGRPILTKMKWDEAVSVAAAVSGREADLPPA